MSCKNWDVLGWSKEKVEQRIDGWREGGDGITWAREWAEQSGV